MIHIKNISKTFRQKNGNFKALDNISLDIAEGDIVGIIGSSGAGKSTLIRCVNLLERPDSGQVIIKGIDLTRLSARRLADERKKIGMIFQHFNLLSSKTVFDNIALPLQLARINKTETERRVIRLLEIVGLKSKAGEYPKNLSGGQKQRVAIARALANDPYVLLCDEATSALDPATTHSILQLLQDINQRLKVTILLITHEMEVVKRICNHIAVLDQGRLVNKGTLEQIFRQDKHSVIKQFINTKTMAIPQELHANIKQKYTEGLFPLVEIELNGNILFDKLTYIISQHYKVPYKLIKADIEYLGKANFGKLLVHLLGDVEKNTDVIWHFARNNIKTSIKGYA